MLPTSSSILNSQPSGDDGHESLTQRSPDAKRLPPCKANAPVLKDDIERSTSPIGVQQGKTSGSTLQFAQSAAQGGREIELACRDIGDRRKTSALILQPSF